MVMVLGVRTISANIFFRNNCWLFIEPAAGLFEGDLFGEAPLEPAPTLQPEPMIDNDSDDDMDGGWVGGPPSTAPRYLKQISFFFFIA